MQMHEMWNIRFRQIKPEIKRKEESALYGQFAIALLPIGSM